VVSAPSVELIIVDIGEGAFCGSLGNRRFARSEAVVFGEGV